MEEDPSRTPWSDQEIDLIVADYFEMLRMELAGEAFVKSHRNAALQEMIKRSAGSIEYKHQNISAVLQALGEPWIIGYKPARNYQKALVDGVERHLDQHEAAHLPKEDKREAGFQEMGELYFDVPPSTAYREEQPAYLRRLVRKFDPAARDARNRALGKKGEERVFSFERKRLSLAGRDDLVRKVRWVSEEDGDGAGYDILSFDNRGKERLLEVKTTTGHERTPFFLSENERQVSTERPDACRLVRLYDFARRPRGFELVPPLEDSVILKAMSYRASFS